MSHPRILLTSAKVFVFVPLLLLSLTVTSVGWMPLAVALDAEVLVIEDVELTPERKLEFTVLPPLVMSGVEVSTTNLTVTENGESRLPAISSLSDEALDVVLVVDTSGSMVGGTLDAAKAAALDFIDAMPVGTRLAVTSFGDAVTVDADFGTPDEARVAVAGLVAAGETALYDAVVESARLFDPLSAATRTMVLVTDGGDTVSEAEIGQANAAIQAGDVQLFAVSFETTESDPAALAALVLDSSGVVVEASDAQGLRDTYGSIATAIQNRYRVAFQTTDVGDVLVEIELRSADQIAQGSFLTSIAPLFVLPPLPPVPTAVPAAVEVPVEVAPTVTVPETQVVEHPGWDWLLPVGIALLAAAISAMLLYLLRPNRRRQNPLKRLPSVSPRDVAAGGAGATRDMARWMEQLAARVLSRRGWSDALALRLDRAGLIMRTSEFLVLLVLACASGFLVGLLVSFGFALALSALLLLAAVGAVVFLGRKRQADFAEQLHGILQTMSGGLRAGYSLTQCVDQVAQQAEEPSASEFRRVLVENHLGRELTESLKDVAERMQSEDFSWVVNAIEVNREIGGDLSEILRNVSRTIRARERVARQVRTLSSEGRLSALILTGLPVALFAWEVTVNREYAELLYTTSFGWVLLISGLVALLVGSLWMRRIARLKF